MKKYFTTLILSIILLSDSYSQETQELKTEEKSSFENMIHVGLIQRFSGLTFASGYGRGIILPISTTMLEFTISPNNKGFFYSSLRISTPLIYTHMDIHPSIMSTIKKEGVTDTRVGFGIGGGYKFGKLNPKTGKGSTLSLGGALIYDFSVYNKNYTREEINFGNGTITMGAEIMARYEHNFNKRAALVLGFDVGFMMSSYKKLETDDWLFDLFSSKNFRFITYGGVLGIRF